MWNQSVSIDHCHILRLVGQQTASISRTCTEQWAFLLAYGCFATADMFSMLATSAWDVLSLWVAIWSVATKALGSCLWCLWCGCTCEILWDLVINNMEKEKSTRGNCQKSIEIMELVSTLSTLSTCPWDVIRPLWLPRPCTSGHQVSWEL